MDQVKLRGSFDYRHHKALVWRLLYGLVATMHPHLRFCEHSNIERDTNMMACDCQGNPCSVANLKEKCNSFLPDYNSCDWAPTVSLFIEGPEDY